MNSQSESTKVKPTENAAGLVAKIWDDSDLAAVNDASAAAALLGDEVELDPSSLNALICEVQAWRRKYPDAVFTSGDNKVVPIPNRFIMRPMKGSGPCS